MMLEKHLLDQITVEDRTALIEVCCLLDKAQQAWNRIESGKQCELNAVHNEDGSLAHCLRWGRQAAEDLVGLTQDVGKPANT